MESVLGRYRNLTILVGVLFLQVLGLAVQVKRSGDAENTRLIRIWAVEAITPFERAIVRVQNGVSELWRDYFYLRGVRAENHQLKEQIEEMRVQQVRLSEDAAQARRLQSLLGFKEQVIAKTVAAQVIGSSGSDLSKSIYIDKGSDDGVSQDMPVITANGIVGKVLRVYPSTSLVLLINDQSSGVGALLEKSRLQGVVHGTANGELMLERVMSDEQVVPGEIVLSSGGDQIFPKGLPLGTITHVSPGKEMFLNIKVKPAADLSRIEEVLVVTEKQEHESLAQGAVRMRAADILAQRLPSVPEKPPASAVSAPGAKNPAAPATPKSAANGAVKSPAVGTMKPAANPPARSATNISTSTGGQNINGTIEQPKVSPSKKSDRAVAEEAPGTGSRIVTVPASDGQPASPKSATAQSKSTTEQSGSQTTESPDSPH